MGIEHEKITHIDLFSGIGGFALAADRVFGNVEHIFCDNEPFSQEVLHKHWPKSFIYGDIRNLTADAEKQRLNKTRPSRGRLSQRIGWDKPFILTGGFPCQPFSQAGRRKGEADDRFLWPEMCRVIADFKPTWVIAENVRGLLTQGGGVVFERVCTDLEALGYEVQLIIIPAVAVGAPHRRDRVWFVAHKQSARLPKSRETRSTASAGSSWRRGFADSHSSIAPNPRRERRGTRISEGVESQGKESERAHNRNRDWDANWLEIASRFCRVDDGVPKRLDRNPRLKALGNAIVPQVAEEIMRAIRDSKS